MKVLHRNGLSGGCFARMVVVIGGFMFSQWGFAQDPLSDLDTPAVQIYVLPEEQPDFDVPLFFEEEGGSPRLELIPGSTVEEQEATRDREFLERFLAIPATPEAPATDPEALPGLFAEDAGWTEQVDEGEAPMKLIFSVPEYLQDMSDAMAALSLQSVMTSFMIFNTTARLYEEGLYTREEALEVTRTYLELLKLSGQKLKRLQQREVDAGRSPTSKFLLAMRELHEQGLALRAWILSGGYTPDPAYAQAEAEARQAIDQLMAREAGEDAAGAALRAEKGEQSAE